MGKRKGKGKPPKQGSITRRDPEAKRKRREESGRPPAPGDDEIAAVKAQLADAEKEMRRPAAAVTAVDDDEPPASEPPDERDSEPPKPRDSEPPAARDSEPPKSEPPKSEGEKLPEGASWGDPLAKLDAAWTRFELRLIVVVLSGLMLVLVFWMGMKSMSHGVALATPAGTTFRSLLSASVLGAVAHLVTRKRMAGTVHTWAVIGGVVAGLAAGPMWRSVGIEFFGGMLDWLQQGSVVKLFNGISGVSIRLAVLVALIGASLACSTGNHIAVDILLRFLPKRWRLPLTVSSALATALVCLLGAWGFFDHLAVTSGAKPDGSPGDKVSAISAQLGEHFFMLRKQLKLDLGTLPFVLRGQKWNHEDRMRGKDWNEFLEREGFVERYGEPAVAAIRDPNPEAQRPPVMRSASLRPDSKLTPSVDLMWPLALLFMTLRMLLRALLMISGHVGLALEGEAEDDEAPVPAEEAA